jgi:hypothetical protein
MTPSLSKISDYCYFSKVQNFKPGIITTKSNFVGTQVLRNPTVVLVRPPLEFGVVLLPIAPDG